MYACMWFSCKNVLLEQKVVQVDSDVVSCACMSVFLPLEKH